MWLGHGHLQVLLHNVQRRLQLRLQRRLQLCLQGQRIEGLELQQSVLGLCLDEVHGRYPALVVPGLALLGGTIHFGHRDLDLPLSKLQAVHGQRQGSLAARQSEPLAGNLSALPEVTTVDK